MKKSLILLVLAFVLTISVFTLASCGGNDDTTAQETTTVEETTTPLQGDDAKAAFDWVDAKMSEVKGFDVVMEMTTDGATETIEMKIDASAEEIKLWFKGAMEGMNMDCTYVDGVFYMAISAEGMTIKMKTSDPEAVAPFKEMADIFEDEDDSVIASAEFVSKEDAKTVIKAVLDDASAKKEALEELGAESEEDLMGMVISEAKSTVTYECDANGMVTKVTKELSYKLDGTLTTTKGTMTITNPGTIPTITAPADADQYMDQDAMIG